MFAQLFSLVVGTLADFLSLALLARFFMQWVGAPFRNPVGQFVLAVTDWAVLPVRKVVPGLFGLDWASFLLAWVVQSLYLSVVVGITGLYGASSGFAVGVVVLSGLVETMRLVLELASAIVIIAALLSWIAPYAPLAPLFSQLADPLLRPVRRLLPPLGGIDLSPMVVLLGLQVLLRVLSYWRVGLLPFFAP
jgi:YggT family protein